MVQLYQAPPYIDSFIRYTLTTFALFECSNHERGLSVITIKFHVESSVN